LKYKGDTRDASKVTNELMITTVKIKTLTPRIGDQTKSSELKAKRVKVQKNRWMNTLGLQRFN
jgi:hypothetical protein